MRVAHVNADALGHVLVIKGVDEAIGGREKHLSGYEVGDLATVFRQFGDDPEQPGNLCGKEDTAQDDAGEDTYRKVAGGHHNHDGRQHHHA
jgi:hypothetical protein